MRKNDHILTTANQELDTLVQESVNIYLTEKFLGRCRHEYKLKEDSWVCSKCGGALHQYFDDANILNANLFTPDGFFLLWGKAGEDDKWFKEFNWYLYTQYRHASTGKCFLLWLNNPLTFPTLLATYLGWKE